MRAAYEAGDGAELLRTYNSASQESAALRAAISSIERFYPLKTFLELAVRLDRDIAGRGLHDGCLRFLRRTGMLWESVVPTACREIAAKEPAIFFGNHPSLLTPFLVAASVDRTDLRYFSTSYVCRLIPSFGEISFPMEVPLTRSRTEWQRGGWKRVLAYRLVSLLHDAPTPEEARAINHQSLNRGASHIRLGGSAMICPGGGGKRDRRWYPGIGSLIKQLQDAPSDRPAYLIPVREENCTNQQVYAHLMTSPLARLKASAFSRQPVRIRFADPIPLADVATASSTVEQIVSLLRARYDAIFSKPELATT